jgi:single-strand DNA-binding protein
VNETHVTVVGNLVADPVLRVTPGQREVAGFRLASTVRRFDPEQGRAVDVRTSFFSVSCWGYLARNVSESVRKGERVVVSGRLELREYTGTDGQPRLSADVVADAVGPDLTYGISRFTRVRRGSADPESAAGAAADEGPAGPVDEADEEVARGLSEPFGPAESEEFMPVDGMELDRDGLLRVTPSPV